MKFSFLQLRAFVAVAETLSFTMAAVQLSMPQPKLSAAIRQMEILAGVRFFERNTRQVRLTEIGQAFLPSARRFLNELGYVESEFQDILQSRQGRLRIACYSSYLGGFLSAPLRQFKDAHPDVKVEIRDGVASQSIQWLLADQVDLAFAPQVKDPSIEDQIFFEPLVWKHSIAALLPNAHPLAALDAIPYAQLVSETVITPYAYSPLHRSGLSALAEHGLSFDHYIRVNEPLTAAGLARAGFGVAVLEKNAAQALAVDGLCVRALVEPDFSPPIGLISLRGQVPTGLPLEFIQILERSARS